MARAPRDFAFYAFDAASRDAAAMERDSGEYLIESAAGRFLEQAFDSLFDSHDIGISMSSDVVICGEPQLSAFAAAVVDVTASVHNKPDKWPITMGYEFQHDRAERGPAIVEYVHKQNLQLFLTFVADAISRARRIGGCIFICGGT